MFTALAPRRALSAFALALFAFCFPRPAAPLFLRDAATSEVAAQEPSPPAPLFAQDLRDPTSSTISLHQWDIPSHQVEWEERAYETTPSLHLAQWDLKKRPRHLNLKPAVVPESSVMYHIRRKARRAFRWAETCAYRISNYLSGS